MNDIIEKILAIGIDYEEQCTHCEGDGWNEYTDEECEHCEGEGYIAIKDADFNIDGCRNDK